MASGGSLLNQIVVIGASAGGIEASKELFASLPEDLPAAVFLVIHIPATYKSHLTAIINRYSKLPAKHPQDGEAVRPGTIYIAPPDRHMVLEEGRVRLSAGPKENGARPAVDPLFRSAAAHASRVIGVVLSGNLDDGVAGLQVIHRNGGITIAQDPDEALFTGMPENAIQTVQLDYVLTVKEIARLIDRLVREPAPGKGNYRMANSFTLPPARDDEWIKQDFLTFENGDGDAIRSVLTCPDCGGVLWEKSEGDLIHYVCHIGHAFSVESLHENHNHLLEHAFWAALRALTEKAALSARLASRAEKRGITRMAQVYKRQVEETQAQMEILRKALFYQKGGEKEEPPEIGKQALEAWKAEGEEKDKKSSGWSPP